MSGKRREKCKCGALLFRGWWCPRCRGCYVCGEPVELSADGKRWICSACGWRCKA